LENRYYRLAHFATAFWRYMAWRLRRLGIMANAGSAWRAVADQTYA